MAARRLVPMNDMLADAAKEQDYGVLEENDEEEKQDV